MKLDTYGYCRANPVIYLDPDGNQFQAIKDVLKNRVMPLVESAGNKLKQTANQVRNTATATINQAKATISQTRDNVVKATKQTLKEGQNFVKENKSDILSVANSMQEVGDRYTKVGLVGAAVGSVTGIGSAPGLTVATAGVFTENAGKILEVTTNFIAGDIIAGAEGTSSYLMSEGAGKLIDVAIPGPNPNMSPMIRDAIDTSKRIIKNSAEKTAEKTVE